MPDPIDISVRLHPGMPVWPGSVGYRRHLTMAMSRGEPANVSAITMDVHCGTHVEAPLHFLDDGHSLDSVGLDVLVGRALVVDVGPVDAIDAGVLESTVPRAHVKRLLLRTRNSGNWADAAVFDADYVALTLDGARWVAQRGIRLIGIDHLSIQLYGDDPETHRVLMRAGVAILEGIDLSHAPAGEYRLTCLPLHLTGAEAAPARAILEAIG